MSKYIYQTRMILLLQDKTFNKTFKTFKTVLILPWRWLHMRFRFNLSKNSRKNVFSHQVAFVNAYFVSNLPK